MQCEKCGYEPTLAEIQAGWDECPGCIQLATQKAVKAAVKKDVSYDVRKAQYDYAGAQPVVVVDLQISFRSMVSLMIKATLAAIPAMIIVFFVVIGLLSFFGGLIASLHKYW